MKRPAGLGPPPRPVRLAPRWAPFVTWVLEARRPGPVFKADGRVLAVQVMQRPDTREWAVIAVDGAAGAGFDGVFDDHAHQDLGSYASIAKAMGVAERFARVWVRSGDVAAKCACGPIAPAKASGLRKKAKGDKHG